MSEAPEVHGPYLNTDRELWRERPGDYYADSLHVTESGGIGINCGGLVFVKPIREWHALAKAQQQPTPGDAVHVGVRAVAAGAGDPRAKQAAENALASAALTVEWLKQLLGCHSPALPAAERLAFAQLLNDKGVLDDAGLLYVRVGVEAELAARETVGAGDRLRLGPAAPGPSAAGGAP